MIKLCSDFFDCHIDARVEDDSNDGNCLTYYEEVVEELVDELLSEDEDHSQDYRSDNEEERQGSEGRNVLSSDDPSDEEEGHK